MERSQFFSALHMPRAKVDGGKRVWGMDLESVVLPHLIATNVMHETDVSLEALGAPIRPNYAKDGTVKFTRNGKPSLSVVKPIRDQVALMRENIIAGIQADTRAVRNDHPEEYTQMVALAKKAGEPIIKADSDNVSAAIKKQIDAAMEEAARKVAAEPTPAPPEPERELVTAQ
jgi:hypothetical protein